MPDLGELLDAALGRVEPTFDIDDLRHRAARRRRKQFITHTIIAVVVPSLVVVGILALNSGTGERSVATANGPTSGGGKPTACAVTKTVSLGSKRGNTFGRKSADGTLSIIVPRDGSYAAPHDPKGGYNLKIPFYRDHAGHLTVRAERLDGPGSATVDMHESSYPPTGFLPTGPLVSDLGCWRITGTQGRQKVSAVIRITESAYGPAG